MINLDHITRVDLRAEDILSRVSQYVNKPLRLFKHFHMTVALDYKSAASLNPDIDELMGSDIKLKTDKLYIGPEHAVLSVDEIQPKIRVHSGVTHITVGLAPNTSPKDSRGLISGAIEPLEVIDLRLSLTGQLLGPAKKASVAGSILTIANYLENMYLAEHTSSNHLEPMNLEESVSVRAWVRGMDKAHLVSVPLTQSKYLENIYLAKSTTASRIRKLAKFLEDMNLEGVDKASDSEAGFVLKSDREKKRKEKLLGKLELDN